ncbi:MAG: hypothetical protein P1U56_25025 [Saprospiraceae bacterium]|nr:hypothetical protein [Saprospiraceae bacterium]
MIRYIIFLLAMVVLASCKQDKKVELPMEEEKVISILGDMHFAISASLIHVQEKRDSMKLIYESQVFEINEISKEEYENLIRILESDLELYYDIEKKVHNYLKNIQNEKK